MSHLYTLYKHSKATGLWVSTLMVFDQSQIIPLLKRETDKGYSFKYQRDIDLYTILDKRKCEVMQLRGKRV